jgi:hypothetical protein
LEEELYVDYDAYIYFVDVTCISDNDDVGNEDDVGMPPLEPWTPTKK